jgi:hypothetical protein
MEKINVNAFQDPRGSESSVKPNEWEKDQEQTHRHPEEQEERIPTAKPDADNGDAVNPLQEPDTESSGYKKENLIPVKNVDKEQEDEDEEEDEDREEMDSDDKDVDSERDKTRSQSGDDFSSPADFNDTNFEDPARGRKTDPMTDDEPRIAGI